MVNCGLVTNKNEAVPLKSIKVDLQIQGHVATVTSTLQYINEEENPVEALFVFPVPSEAAICHFSAKIADQEIVAEVQEKQKAREEYDDALSSGHQAFLLEESEESADVFRMSVGALPPKQSAAITFIYVIELCVQADHSLRFCLPAVLNPRYTPPGTGGGIVSEITSNAGGVPYSLSLTAEVSSPNPITKVESNCPLDPLEFLNTDHSKAKVNLGAGHMFDRDIELFVYYQNPHQLTAIVEAGDPTAKPGTLMGDPVVMLSFYPEFPQSVMSSVTSCGEFVFLMDRSGSMSCTMHNGQDARSRIECARDTLLLLLKSLPMGCYFNIYGFGSRYESFFPKSVQYSEETMEQAVVRVKQLQADMGGTEILQPLEHIYSQACIPNHPRQLFIFTDGEVGNTRDVLNRVRCNADSHRCFSFGIGEGASTALIKGMAENGSGYAQFITGTDRMQAKVMQSLQYALQPAVVDIREVWTGVAFTRLNPPINTLFNGQRALIYAQLKGEECDRPDATGNVSVQYRLGDKEITNTLEFSIKPTENSRLTIHRLGARSLIRSLEKGEQDEGANKEALKTRVVEVSMQSGVSSSHTAFIAIHKASGQAVKGPMMTRRVPTARMCGFGVRRSCSAMPMMIGMAPQMARSAMPMMPGGGMMMPRTEGPGSAMPMMSGVGMMMPRTEAQGIAPKKKRMAPQMARGGMMMPRMSGMASRRHRKCMATQMDCLDESLSLETDGDSETSESLKDPLLQLVSLQKASGCWEMGSALAQVFGKTEEELIKQTPAQVEPGVWATLLALIWLHGFKMDAQVEWQFVAMKAATWVRTQKVDSLVECIRLGNSLLGCQVKEDALGF